MPAPSRVVAWGLLSLCLLRVGVQSIDLTAPFLRRGDENGRWYGIFARNYARHGLQATRGAPLYASWPDLKFLREQDSPPDRFYYLTRPPLSPLLLAATFRLFGESEASFRLLLILLGLAAVLLFFGIARRLPGCGNGLLATAFFALNPMTLHFGLNTIHYVLAMPLTLLAWYAALRIPENRRFPWLLYPALFVGGWTDWPCYLGALSLAAHFLLRKERGTALAVLTTAAMAFLFYLLFLWNLAPDGRCVEHLFAAGAYRVRPASIPATDYLVRESREIALHFTIGLLLSAGLGILHLFRSRAWPALLLALLTLEEFVLFFQAYHNEFTSFFWAPFLAVSGAAGIRALGEQPRRRILAFALVSIFAVQSAVQEYRLLRQWDPSIPEYRAARVISRNVAPDERAIVALNWIQFYYADRYVYFLRLDPVVFEDSATGMDEGFSDLAAWRAHLEQTTGKYAAVVVGASEDPLGHYHPDSFDRRKVFLPPDHPLRQLLQEISAGVTFDDGFAIYKLTAATPMQRKE